MFYFTKFIMVWVWYLIIWIYISITFWAILMWIDKMSKVVIWNYLAWITCFAFGNIINQRVNWLMTSPTSKFIGISYSKLADFLSAGQLTLVMLLFIGLIRLMFACSKIQVSYTTRASTEKLYFVILIPITVLSFVIGPYIAFKADWIQVLDFIENTLVWTFWFFVSFIKNLPFWMFANWIAFMLIISHINLKISLSSKSTKLPEWI